MSTFGPPAGWYPDPNDASSLRWWDGQQWTAQCRATACGVLTGAGATEVASSDNHAPTGYANGIWGSHPGRGPAAGYGQPVGSPPLSAARPHRRDHYSLITFGVCGLYLVLAFVTHFVLIGFIPLAISLRARRSAEPLAPLAMAAAIGVILISLVTLMH